MLDHVLTMWGHESNNGNFTEYYENYREHRENFMEQKLSDYQKLSDGCESIETTDGQVGRID